MATSDTLAQLQSRILSHFSMMFLTTWEEERWEAEIAALALEMDRGLVTWTATCGVQPLASPDSPALTDPAEFLAHVCDFPREQLFLLGVWGRVFKFQKLAAQPLWILVTPPRPILTFEHPTPPPSPPTSAQPTIRFWNALSCCAECCGEWLDESRFR